METKLSPRQSPQKPPKPEMKSIQVIFGDLSNSELIDFINFHLSYNIHTSYQTLLNLQRRCSRWRCPCHRRCRVFGPYMSYIIPWIDNRSNDLGEWSYELLFFHGVRVLVPQRAWNPLHIAGRPVSVRLQNARLPHLHCEGCRGRGQLAKRTQIEVAWVAGAENITGRNQNWPIFCGQSQNFNSYLNSTEVIVGR